MRKKTLPFNEKKKDLSQTEKANDEKIPWLLTWKAPGLGVAARLG